VNPQRDDDQWLYLPELRRVRRISATERGTFFLGTDFTYENIKNETKIADEDYDWTFLGWQTSDGCDCIILEGAAKSDRIAKQLRHKIVLRWVDPETWLSRRLEYWSEDGEKTRTITAHDIRQVQGIWTVHEFRAENHERDGRSIFRFSDVDYETPLGDELFSQQALQRGLP
jgi:outer membrane lipoprotein-sorting protein